MLGTNQKKSREETERAVQETKKEADQRLRQMERRYVDQLNALNSQLKVSRNQTSFAVDILDILILAGYGII